MGGEPNILGDMKEQAWLKVIGVNLNAGINCKPFIRFVYSGFPVFMNKLFNQEC